MRAGLDGFVEVSTLRRAAPAWQWSELVGRLVELSGARADASLSAVLRIVLDAQRRAEHVAWIGTRTSSFHPPDVAESGVDLDALIVVRLSASHELAFAADGLARSGVFGLLVLDLTTRASIPMPLQSRLLSLAQKHGTAILCVTAKASDEPSLSSLVSLRGEASLRRTGRDAFVCELTAVKDKRRSRLWSDSEVRRGTVGLR